jgi:PEGA domain
VYRNGDVYRNGGVYRSAPRGYYNYNNFYVYPRRSYPYGYGGFGLGYFYYDPYRWFPDYYGGVYSGGGPYGYGGYYGGAPGYGGGYGYDVGQLRLRVTPRDAEVYVDGYYAGTVDDYDGIAQSLTLESGPYRIELVAPGYEPLEFQVRITPGQKVTYRGDLKPRP